MRWLLTYLSKASDMRILEQLRFSVRGFSAKRMAFAFVLISVLSWPLHLRADWKGDEYLTELAFGCMVAAFALGYLVPRTDKQRFLPASLALLMTVMHWFFCKL